MRMMVLMHSVNSCLTIENDTLKKDNTESGRFGN